MRKTSATVALFALAISLGAIPHNPSISLRRRNPVSLSAPGPVDAAPYSA